VSTTTDLEKPTAGAGVPLWHRGLTWAGLVGAGFTALCCLGVSAALSLASAVGATFLTQDSSLRPILAGTLALTVAGSALTYWRHRRPGPLILTALAAVWAYGVIFLVGGTHAAHGTSTMADHMTDHMADHASGHAGLGGGRLALAWTGLAVLVAAPGMGCGPGPPPHHRALHTMSVDGQPHLGGGAASTHRRGRERSCFKVTKECIRGIDAVPVPSQLIPAGPPVGSGGSACRQSRRRPSRDDVTHEAGIAVPGVEPLRPAGQADQFVP
jgi:hypothetical protein